MCDVGAWLVYGTCETLVTESAKVIKEHSLAFSVVRKRLVEGIVEDVGNNPSFFSL